MDNVFDAIEHVMVVRADLERIREAWQELANLREKKCGHCYHWMKCTCEPEKKYRQFKSCNSLPCCDFIIDPLHDEIIRQNEQDLTDAVNSARQDRAIADDY